MVLLTASGWGCGSDAAVDTRQDVAVSFEAVVGAKPFSCRETFIGIGSKGAAVKLLDFRSDVHDIALTPTGVSAFRFR